MTFKIKKGTIVPKEENMNIFAYILICFIIEVSWVFTMFSKANRLQASGNEAQAENYFILALISIWVGPMIFILLGLAIASAT